MELRRFALAVLVLSAAVSLSPGAAQANDQKIAALFEASFADEVKGTLDSSINAVLNILRLEPNSYIANYRAGWLYYIRGKYDQSIKFYQRAASLQPGALEARLALMLPMMASKYWPQAEALGKELLVLAPMNYLAGSRLAYIYFSQGKYAAAEAQYKKVLSAFPSELEMMLGLGWTYLKQGRKREAKRMFEQVLRVRRHNLNAKAGLESLL